MHASRQLLYERLAVSDRAAILTRAVALRTSVERIIGAIFNQPAPASEQATLTAALLELGPELTGRVRATILDAGGWPAACDCCGDVAKKLGRCAHCSVVGCACCVAGDGCPSCKNVAASKRLADRAAEQAAADKVEKEILAVRTAEARASDEQALKLAASLQQGTVGEGA